MLLDPRKVSTAGTVISTHQRPAVPSHLPPHLMTMYSNLNLSLDLTLDPTLDLYLDPNLDLNLNLNRNMKNRTAQHVTNIITGCRIHQIALFLFLNVGEIVIHNAVES